MNKTETMPEKILKIETDVSFDSYEGFKVITDKQTIFVGISNGQCCCENTGYFVSQDDLSDFIGSELLNIKLTDTCLRTKDWHIDNLGCSADQLREYLDEGDVMFVDFETSKGTFQFTVYNSHNGYYGHEAVVISNQLNHSKDL